MDWQNIVVMLLVAACFGHALRALLPRSLRLRFAAWRGKTPVAASGCGGCDGCGSARPAAAQPTAGLSVIRIVRRPPSA